jgi:hypothetical protein
MNEAVKKLLKKRGSARESTSFAKGTMLKRCTLFVLVRWRSERLSIENLKNIINDLRLKLCI